VEEFVEEIVRLFDNTAILGCWPID